MKWPCAVCLLFLMSLVAAADDWPQWLGPHRDGTTSEKIKPWTDIKVLWRKKVGPGHSSPIVAHGKVFLHTRGKNIQHDLESTTERVFNLLTVSGKSGY